MQCFMNSNGVIVQRLYKKLECLNFEEINQQILDHIVSLNIVDQSQNFWNSVHAVSFLQAAPLFRAWLETQGFRLHSLAVTIGTHPECCGIHIDTPPAINKLSWPVANTKHTYNRWYRELVKDPKIFINSLGGKSFLDRSELEEIGRMEVVGPCIINAGIPHDVWCSPEATFPRIGLQCMLFHEPVL